MRISPREVTLDALERSAILESLEYGIRARVGMRDKCKEGGYKWCDHEEKIAYMSDVRSKIMALGDY